MRVTIVAVALLGAVLLVKPVAAAVPQKTEAVAKPTVVQVQMYEMGFKFRRQTPRGAWGPWTRTPITPLGVVEFRTVNVGAAPHDLVFRGLPARAGTRVLEPQERQTIRVRLARPGTVRFLCTVEGHAAAGMLGRLTVR
jgi:FtsP/CotA-like multicopper oxidase with cupredoxin domain